AKGRSRVSLSFFPDRGQKQKSNCSALKPDTEVAGLVGRSVAVVRQLRALRNIPPVIEPGEARRWTTDEERLLGTKSDQEIARLLERTPRDVQARREKRKIPIANPLR